MKFELEKSIEILERTPFVLDSMLRGLSNEWLRSNEGEETWSPYNVLGHLIYGEKTDWVIRTKIILADSMNKTFVPFDRFAQLRESQDRSIAEMLEEFMALRAENLSELRSLDISDSDLQMKGNHPELGSVALKHLLSAWTVHDLGHIAQISRVMAKQYAENVGPWTEYLTILAK